MGAAKLLAKISPSDYFLSTLFSREQALRAELEFVVAHEVGHAIANTLLDYPIEFTSVTVTFDGKIGGFTSQGPRGGRNAAERSTTRVADSSN
jgi:ATP-dependent Zn protease